MRGSRKFGQRGSNFDNFFRCFFLFLVDEGGSKNHYKRAIIGPPAKRHRRADDDPTSNACLLACDFQEFLTCIGSKPYIFVIFRGGESGLPAPPPSGSAHDFCHFISPLRMYWILPSCLM